MIRRTLPPARPALAAALGVAVLSLAGLAAQSAVDRPRLLEDLRILSADDMQGREIATAGGAKARAFIVERFREVGLRPINETFEWPFAATPGLGRRVETRTGVNVVGVIGGARQPQHYVVISAHYDHIGTRNGQVFNGADDNASGTAALFAIATHFMRARPATSLLFVAFDGEEPGMLGSRAFVANPPVPREALLFDVNVDMIGRDPNNELWVSGTRGRPALRAVVETVAATAPVKLRIGHDDPANPQDDWTVQSDQLSFLQARIPAVYVGVADEANHHRASDDYETITYDFYVKAVQTVIQFVEALDARHDTLVEWRQSVGNVLQAR